jgi:hypothetical protein
MTDCISFGAWMPYALGVALTFGMAIGVSVRLCLDWAELAAYRRIARLSPEMVARLLAK